MNKSSDQSFSINELIPEPVKTVLTQFGQKSFPPGEWVKEPQDVVPLALFLARQLDSGLSGQSYGLIGIAP